MLKDLDLMLQAGEGLDVPLVQTAITSQWMRSALAHGEGEKDYAVVIKAIERMSGLDSKDWSKFSRILNLLIVTDYMVNNIRWHF